MAETVLYEKTENIVTITLNRPDSLNSINRQLRADLAEAITNFDGDADARVAIVTGAGRAFCAGRDFEGAGQRQRGWSPGPGRRQHVPGPPLHVAPDLEAHHRRH